MNKLSWFDHKIVIDRHVWRCGGDGKYSHGSCATQMCDHHGMMCCLGQEAFNCGIPKDNLIGYHNPCAVIRSLNKSHDSFSHIAYIDRGVVCHTVLANDMITINDCESYTDSRRELELFLCAKKHRVFIQFVGEYQNVRDCRADGPRRSSSC